MKVLMSYTGPIYVGPSRLEFISVQDEIAKARIPKNDGL
jgi:hypothetical protein